MANDAAPDDRNSLAAEEQQKAQAAGDFFCHPWQLVEIATTVRPHPAKPRTVALRACVGVKRAFCSDYVLILPRSGSASAPIAALALSFRLLCRPWQGMTGLPHEYWLMGWNGEVQGEDNLQRIDGQPAYHRPGDRSRSAPDTRRKPVPLHIRFMSLEMATRCGTVAAPSFSLAESR